MQHEACNNATRRTWNVKTRPLHMGGNDEYVILNVNVATKAPRMQTRIRRKFRLRIGVLTLARARVHQLAEAYWPIIAG